LLVLVRPFCSASGLGVPVGRRRATCPPRRTGSGGAREPEVTGPVSPPDPARENKTRNWPGEAGRQPLQRERHRPPAHEQGSQPL